MRELISPPAILVKDTETDKGRAVYANREFLSGDLVEGCPVIIVRFDHVPPEIKRIAFNWEGLLCGTATGSAIALGYGSLYNHATQANMRYEADAALLVIRFIALRQIQRGEELTINYNSPTGGPDEHGDHWFKQMNVQPFE
jgi:uncharacterized protein